MSGSRACRPSPRRRPLRGFAPDAGAATSVEFGLIAGVLFALLFGITDFGYAFWQWSIALLGATALSAQLRQPVERARRRCDALLPARLQRNVEELQRRHL